MEEYNSKDSFLQSCAQRRQSVELIQCHNYETTIALYNHLIVAENAILPSPYGTFRTRQRNPKYFVVAAKPYGGLSLQNFLSIREQRFLFTDFLPEEAFTKRSGFPKIRKSANHDPGIKVGISSFYRSILSQLIYWNSELDDAHFRAVFDMESVVISLEMELKIYKFELLENAAMGRQWGTVPDLIKAINKRIAVDEHPLINNDLVTLRERIENGNVENMMKMTLFWNYDKKAIFIYSLCSILHADHVNHLWHLDIHEAFCNWESRATEFTVFGLLIEEHDKERRRLNLPPRFIYLGDNGGLNPTLREEELRACINFIRQAIQHFDQMIRAINSRTLRQPLGITTRQEFQQLLEYVFPGHMQMLVNHINNHPIFQPQLAYITMS